MAGTGNIRKALGPAKKILQDKISEPVENLSISDLTKLKGKLEKACSRVEDLRDQLFSNATDDEDITDLLTTIENLLNKADDRTMDINEMIRGLDSNNYQDPMERVATLLEKMNTTLSAKPAAVSIDPQPNVQTVLAKLPQLHLAKFYGNPIHWFEFWSSFQINIHNRADLTPSQKFSYLKTSLKGRASLVISGLLITDENYQLAIKKLLERYNQSQTLIAAHMDSLNKIPTSTTHTYKLRETFDRIEKDLCALESLGENTNTNFLLPLILKKFPEAVRDKVAEICEGHLTVTKVRKALSSIILNKEIAFSMIRTTNSSDKGSGANSSHSTTESSVFLAHDNRIKKCIYCGNEQHYSDQCKTYDTLNKRLEKLKEEKRCTVCLNTNHSSDKCRFKSRTCQYCKEKKAHHRSLCPSRIKKKSDDTKNSEESSTVPTAAPVSSVMLACGQDTYMPTLLVTIVHNSTSAVVRLFLDTGAQRSYITTKFATMLKLPVIGKEDLSIMKFASRDKKDCALNMSPISLVTKEGDAIPVIVNVIPFIAGRVRATEENLPNIILAKDDDSREIELLIGSDYYWKFFRNATEIKPNVFLIETVFGNVLAGTTSLREESGKEGVSLFCSSVVNAPEFSIEKDVAKLYDLENIGIYDSPDIKDDDLALANFYKTVKFTNDRYYVQWPWIVPDPDLPSNYGLAFGRLRSLVKKSTSEFLFKYNAILDEYLQQGIIEKIEPCDSFENKLIYYMPHHAVIKENKKMRIVFDASSKAHKSIKSLNDCLHRGPVLLEGLCSLLLNFRLHKIGVTADIEKAFLEIGLQSLDRDVTRLLWLRDHTNFSPRIDRADIQEYRFCRIPFGVVSSPFLLNAAILEHIKNNAEAKWKNKLRFYVDNLVTGCNTEEEASELYTYSKNLFKQASMNLRQFSSNGDFYKTLPLPDKDDAKTVGILGLLWHIENDELSLKNKLKVFLDTPTCTRRVALKVISTVFDPMGWYCPWILEAKIFLQTLIEETKSWDAEAPDKIDVWKQIKNDLRNISKMRIPRSIYNNTTISYELHTFCDASSNAFGTCLYLRQITNTMDGKKISDLIFAKHRLKPCKKNITIPRMELLGAFVGSRCTRFVRSVLNVPITKSYMWLDSKCVLGWIRSKKILPSFVERRVNVIKQQRFDAISYVRSHFNPADLLTRVQNNEQMNSDLWWHGPTWLTLNNEEWETELDFEEGNPIQELEFEEAVLPIITERIIPPFNLEIKNFSSLSKLINVTSHCLRFTKNTLDPYHVWITYIQKLHYHKEIRSLESNSHKTNLTRQLDLWLDEKGIIRCGGRLHNISKERDTVFPILLHKKCSFTNLIIKHYHNKLFHVGVQYTLAEVRQHYWIPQGRRAVTKVRRNCLICQKYMSGPFKQPRMPPIPLERVDDVLPFKNVGLDIYGPFLTKNDRKVYGCIFACMQSRAVHLELANNMTAEEISHCLRRFMSRRGTPDLVVSDHGSQLKTISRHLVNVPSFTWKFIIELSPWMGGFYERLIGIIKQCIIKTVRHKKLSVTELTTLLTEIEYVVNSRPLLYVGDDSIDDMMETSILSPLRFLNQRKINLEVRPKSFAESPAGANVLQSWKTIENLKQFFTMQWKKLYLPSLRTRYQMDHHQPRNVVVREPIVGEVVQLKDYGPRSTWRLGKIIQLNFSRDGQIRSVRVRTSKNTLVRPLSLVYPLELDPVEQNVI